VFRVFNVAGVAEMAYENLVDIIREIHFVELVFDTTPLLVNTSPLNLEFDGRMWIGTGILGEISAPKQNIDMTAGGVAVRLSGVPTDKIIDARGEKYRNRKANIYLGTFNHEWVVESAPLMVFSGIMDSMSIVASGETASITVDIKSELSEWSRPKIYRYTNEMQVARFPNDKGFEFVAIQKNRVLNWGVV